MTVIKKEPGRPAEAVAIKNTLEALQEAVGGYIEVVPFVADTVIICDEEGKLKDSHANFFALGDLFCGTVLFAGVKGEEFCSIKPYQIKAISAELGI